MLHFKYMTRKSLERNVKLYPFYRAFSYDFLFLWTISILFLTWKGLTYSQTIWLDSIFMLVAFILQVPLTKLVQKIGQVNAIRMAALCRITFSLIFIFCNSFIAFAIANFFYGIAASISNVSDAQLLSNSLRKLDRSNEFSKIEGRGMYWYYIIESVSAIASGYMFSYLHPLAPIIGTLTCSIILLLLGFLLKEPKDEIEPEYSNTKDVLMASMNKVVIKKKKHVAKAIVKDDHVFALSQNLTFGENEKKDKKSKSASYKTLLKDKFIISMMIFCFCYYGIMSVYSTLAKVYYQDIGAKAWMFGYIYFVFKIVAAVSSKFQFKYEKKHGVKSLIIFSLLTLMTFGLNGVMATIDPNMIGSIIIISAMFIVQNAIRAPYRIFVKNYINSSTNKETLAKSLTLYSMAEYLGFTFITMIVAAVMDMTSNNFGTTNLIITGIVAVPMLISIVIFIREIIKRHTKTHTIIRQDMKDDL